MISSCVLLEDFCPRATTFLAGKKKGRKIPGPANASSSTLHPLLLTPGPLNLIRPTWIWDFFEVSSVVG